jgi:hypothetical protein
MKRSIVAGICLIAALAVTGVLSAAASAAAPEFGRCVAKAGGKYATSACDSEKAKAEKYEWLPGPGANNKFTSHIKSGTKATLETVKKLKVTCTGETSTGEVATAKEVAHVVAIFTGCISSGLKCHSSIGGTQAEGEIKTNPMHGGLGVEKEGTKPPLNNKLAEELTPEGGGEFTSFVCAGISVKVKGAVLHPITTDKMINKATEKFAASKGKQKPEKYVGGSPIILESSFSGGPYEQSGQTITTETTFEESGEANTVA